MVEFSENLESGPSGSGRPRQGHPRPQPILKPSRWAFSCCTPAMSPPTPEDELPEESPTQTPTPVPTPSSTTALGRSETTPPRAVVHAPSPSDEATRAAYIAAADFDDDVPLPGETLTSEELEFYSDVREEQDAPGEDPFTSGLPSWLEDTSDDEVLPATPVALYHEVTQEPSMEHPPVAGGESPGAERGADDVADVSVADLLDAANAEDPAFAFKPQGVARAAFQSVLYGNYGGPVDDDETLGESSFERDPPARGRGDDDATPSPSRTRREDDDEDIEEEHRGSEVNRDVAKLWSDMHATRTARETRVQDMRAFLRRVRGGDDANDRRVKFPPSPATATGDESEEPNEFPESHPESRTATGPTRVAAVSPRETAVRALEDRDWSPMLPSTRVGLQRLVDGDTAAVDDDEDDENDSRRDEASTMDRPPVASTSELRTALGLPAKTQFKAGGTRRPRTKKPHAERYAFGSSVETGRGEKWRLAAEAAERDSNPPHFLRRGDGKPRSFIPTPHTRSAIRADAAERQEARLREQWRRWRVSQRERKERMNAEAERTRATEESALGRGLRERPSNEANRDKDASVEHKPAGKRIVVRDEVEEEENEPGGSVVVEEEKEEEETPLVLYSYTTSTGAQCDLRDVGADTAVQVRMDAISEDAAEPRVVLSINVVDDGPRTLEHLNPEHLNQGRSNQTTEAESVKSAFETLGYYAAAGVDSADAQVQTMGREERLAHGRLHVDVADAAGALRSGEFPDADEAEAARTNPTVTKLQLQLRAVGVLVGAQRMKHARRLAALRERYVEVMGSLREQDKLLTFSAAAEKIRSERQAAVCRRRRGATERWRPPGGGVFLDARRPGSHNVHVQSRGAAWSVDPHGHLPEGAPDDDDPWRGSAFKREMLASLGRKLLMKCALGAFAAAAAEKRGLEAYVRRVWSRNRAPAVRIAFDAMRTVAARMTQLCEVADDAAELRLRRRCGAACALWSKIAVAGKSERKACELARAHRDRRALDAALSQWRRLPLMTEFATHADSLANSFRNRKMRVSSFHVWRLLACREAFKKLKLEAAMPGEPTKTAAAKARLDAARKPSEVRARAEDATRETSLEFKGSRRRVAPAEAAAALRNTDGRLRYRATEADCRWVSLASPHMRRFRRLAVDEINDEEEGYKGSGAAVRRTREALEHLRKVRKNGSGAFEGLGDEHETTELLEAARKRAAAMRVFETPGAGKTRARMGAVTDDDAPQVPPLPALDPADVTRVKLAAGTDDVAVKARTLARDAARDAQILAQESDAKVTSAKAAQKFASETAGAVASSRLDRARHSPPSPIDASSPTDADAEAKWAAADARAEHLADTAASAAVDATREAIAAEAAAAAAKAIASAAAGIAQVAEAVALEVHDARARADASDASAKVAAANVTKARAAADSRRRLADDAARNMDADPETVSEIRKEADASTARASALERDAALARVEAETHGKAATSAVERRDAARSAVDGLESATRGFKATRNWREDAYKRLCEADALAAESVATARAAEAVDSFWAKRLERAERDVAAAATSEEAAAAAARDEKLSFIRREAKRLRAEAEASESAKLIAMAHADAAEKAAGDIARASSDEASAAREAVGTAGARLEASVAEREVARQKVETLRRRAESATRSARVHVDLAAEAAAYGRELASDPGFRAQKAEAFAAAVVEAEGVLSDVELKTVRAEHDLNEVRAAASAAERTAASIATAEIERSLEFRASADDAMRRHREVSKLADEAEAEARTLEKFDDPVATHRDLGQRAREERCRAESQLASAAVDAERRAEECVEFKTRSVNAREDLRSVASVSESAPVEMTRVATSIHELLSAIGTDAKRSHGLADAERADSYLLTSAARWREEAARLAAERERVETARNEAKDREAFAASAARIAIADDTNSTDDVEAATADVAKHADTVRRLDARRQSLTRDASDALRVASAAEAQLAAAAHDRTLAAAAAAAATNERIAASRQLVAKVAGALRASAAVECASAAATEREADRVAKEAADDSRRKSAALTRASEEKKTKDAEAAAARDRAEKARRTREAAVAEARRRVEAARAAAADEARAVAQYEEEAAKERAALEAMRARHAAARAKAEREAYAARRQKDAAALANAELRRAEQAQALEASAAEAEAKRAGERERNAAERRERVATREHRIAEDEKDALAAVRIDNAEREANDRLLAATRAAEEAERLRVLTQEAEVSAAKEAEDAAAALAAAEARNKRFTAVVDANEREKTVRIELRKKRELAAARVAEAEAEAEAAIAVAREKRAASERATERATEAESRRSALSDAAEAAAQTAAALAPKDTPTRVDVVHAAAAAEMAEAEAGAVAVLAADAGSDPTTAAAVHEALDAAEARAAAARFSARKLADAFAAAVSTPIPPELESARERALDAADAAERAASAAATLADARANAAEDARLQEVEAGKAAAKKADAEAASARAIAEEFSQVKKQCGRVLEHLKAQHAAGVEEAEADAARCTDAETEEAGRADSLERSAAAAAELERSLASAQKDASMREKTTREAAVFAKFAASAKKEEERAAADAETAAVNAANEALDEARATHADHVNRAVAEASEALREAKAELDTLATHAERRDALDTVDGTGAEELAMARDRARIRLEVAKVAAEAKLQRARQIADSEFEEARRRAKETMDASIAAARAEADAAAEKRREAEEERRSASLAAAVARKRSARVAAAAETEAEEIRRKRAETEARAVRAAEVLFHKQSAADSAMKRAKAAEDAAVNLQSSAVKSTSAVAEARASRDAEEEAAFDRDRALKAANEMREWREKATAATNAAKRERDRAEKAIAREAKARERSERAAAAEKKKMAALEQRALAAEEAASATEAQIKRRVKERVARDAEAAAKAAAKAVAEEAERRAREEADDKARARKCKARAALAAKEKEASETAAREADKTAAAAEAEATYEARERAAVARAQAEAKREAAESAEKYVALALAEAAAAAELSRKRAVRLAEAAAAAERAVLEVEREDALARERAATARADAAAARELEVEAAAEAERISAEAAVEAAKDQAAAILARERAAEAEKRAAWEEAEASRSRRTYEAEMDSARMAEERAQSAMDELNAAVKIAAEDADRERLFAENAAREKAEAERLAEREELRRLDVMTKAAERLRELEARAAEADAAAAEEASRLVAAEARAAIAEEALRAANEKVEEAARAAANGAIVASRAGLESFESLPAPPPGGDLKALEAASGTTMPMGRSAVPRGRRLPPRQPTAAARRVAEARTAFSTFPRTTKASDGMSASDGGDESSSPGQKRKSIAVEDIDDDLPKVQSPKSKEEEAELKEKQVKAARERAVRRVRAVRRAAAASGGGNEWNRGGWETPAPAPATFKIRDASADTVVAARSATADMNRAEARFRNRSAAKVTYASSPRLITTERSERRARKGINRGSSVKRQSFVPVRPWTRSGGRPTNVSHPPHDDRSSGKRRKVDARKTRGYASAVNVASRVFERVFDRVYHQEMGGGVNSKPAIETASVNPPIDEPGSSDTDDSMISVNLDATHTVAGLEHSSWAVAGRTDTTFPVVSASRVDSSLDAAAVRLRGLLQQARALRALQSNAQRARHRHEIERRDVPMLRLKHSMRRFVSAVRLTKATRLAEEEARLSAAERVQLERARSFAFAHRGSRTLKAWAGMCTAANWRRERLANAALTALANRALRKRFEKQLVTAARERLGRARAPAALFKRWCERCKRRALLRRVLRRGIAARRRLLSRRGWYATPLSVYARSKLRMWRLNAKEFRETRKEKRKIWRADTARKLRLQLNAFGTWVRVRDESAELHRIAAAFFTAFLGWRHVTRTRAALRNSLKQRGVRRLAELAVRSWRGWRRRTALTAAADAMRLRSLVRFTRPRFTAWRIVSLAKCRGRILAEMRVDGCRRHVMWRAWRAWYLGPALAGFTAGAPTPSPPEDSAVIASTYRRTERGGHVSNVEEDADYFGGDRPAASPAPPVQLPIRAATRRDAVASTDAYRAVKLGAAFRVWRSSRGARIVSRLARHHEAEEEEEERGGGEGAAANRTRMSAGDLAAHQTRVRVGGARTTRRSGVVDTRDARVPFVDARPRHLREPRREEESQREQERLIPEEESHSWPEAERDFRDASDALIGTARPLPRDFPETRDWFLAEDRAWAAEREARAAAAAAEAMRFPAYAAADPEVVVGALRELRETRWTDPRTLRHGASGGRDFEDGGSRR